jgi:hypothetical protein
MTDPTLYEALVRLRDEGRPDWSGICSNLRRMRAPVHEFIQLATAWPKYSGTSQFPIPDPYGRAPAYPYASTANMWSKRSAYGRLRWELLHWCIAELEKDDDTH